MNTTHWTVLQYNKRLWWCTFGLDMWVEFFRVFAPSGSTFQMTRNQECLLCRITPWGHNLPPESPCKAPWTNNAFVFTCQFQRKGGGKILGSGMILVSSCCMSDKLKGYRYEHWKILEKQWGEDTTAADLLRSKMCSCVIRQMWEERKTYIKYPPDGQGNSSYPWQAVPQIFPLLSFPLFWWVHERLLVEFKRQGQACERGWKSK